MRKSGFVFTALILCILLTMSGCSSAQKKLSEEVKGIKTKVDTLETRVEGVEAKQAENEHITAAQSKEAEEMNSEKSRPMARTNIEIKHRKNPKDKERTKEIQTCLKNAGFYKGEVDGVKGRKTRSAIKKFQKANGLTADGVVGGRTWDALNKYSSGGAGAVEKTAEEEATTK